MTIDERASLEANRLYWETGTPVAEIADRLDLSRRALYEAIRPFEAGAACPQCGAGLSFANRSARRTGTAGCSECGHEQVIDGGPAATMRAAGQAQPGARGDDGLAAREDMRAPDLRQRAVVLGGAAIAGVALGTVAALWAIRRD
jgi:Zn ribbon nucleic-acid-binding protein